MSGFGKQFEHKKQNIKKNKLNSAGIGKIVNQAFVLHSQGNIKEAIKIYKYCIDAKVYDAKVYSNYGLILKNHGNFKKAEVFLRKAVEINPNSASAFTNLGTILKDLKKFNKAEECYRKAIEIEPNFTLAYINLGNILREFTKFKEAEVLLRKALDINPKSTLACFNLGEILKSMGKLEEAKKLLLQTIETNPKFVEPYYSLSKLSFSKEDISWQNHLFSEKILVNKNSKEKIAIYFARSNILHKEKKYKESANNLEIANKLKLKIYPSDVDQIISRSNLLVNTGNTEKKTNKYDKYPTSIFIVGMPRSGTTLLESIVSLNEEVKDLGEINIFEKAYIESKKIDQQTSLTDLYIQKIQKLGVNSSITTNKWLYNYQYAGIIANQISNSKIIHCIRNPLDNILSITRANFSTGNSYSASIKDCANVYMNQAEVMKVYKNRFGSSIYEMNYDLLVTEPEKAIRSLIKWLGWEWQENYLLPHTNQRTILTASDVQVRSPINSQSLGGWKNYKEMLRTAMEIITQKDKYKELKY